MTVSPLPTARGDGAGRIGCWLFILALSVYVVTVGGSMTITDAVVMFDVTQNVVRAPGIRMGRSRYIVAASFWLSASLMTRHEMLLGRWQQSRAVLPLPPGSGTGGHPRFSSTVGRS